MDPDNLVERVADLIGAHRRSASRRLTDELGAVERRLSEPLRVAVVGRVKAGKSTLVNALLGQPVAPTDVSECTKLVTWFRFGRPQRVVVDLEDGNSKEQQLDPGGRLPAELDTGPAKATAVHAFLTNEALKSMTIIDTPGLGSVHESLSSSTHELLAQSRDTAAAAASADAVVLVMSQVVLEDELEALALFRASDSRRQGISAGNVLGVLSRADQLGDGSADPWELAVALASTYADRLRAEMSTVVPVIGLLAETAETAALTETDARAVADLAAMAPAEFERLLWSPDRFVGAEAAVPVELRERLLGLLDLYGVGRAVELARGGQNRAAGLRRELSRLSGIAKLKRTLLAQFEQRDQLLKARSALDALQALSFVRTDEPAMAEQLQLLRADVEALRLSPAMHAIAVMEAAQECATGLVPLPASLLDEARRLFRAGEAGGRSGTADRAEPPEGGADEDAGRLALEGMERWRLVLSTVSSPAAARVARTAHRSYQLAWARAS